jgi:hypothetical protein
VAGLDDDAAAVREASEQALAALGPRAWPTLREAMEKGPSAEVRKRLSRLLDENRQPSEVELRGQRCIRVLEWAGDVPARELLKTLSGGDPTASLTVEAKAALRRIKSRLTE